jgi:hypothetical protein
LILGNLDGANTCRVVDLHLYPQDTLTMNKNPPDERVVYLALKNLFKGSNAQVRQPKAIRKLIASNQAETEIADLIAAHNIDSLCGTARTLLTEQVFESTLKAKIRFPEVFEVSPTQSAEREASEITATRNEAKAIENVQRQQEHRHSVAQSLQPGNGNHYCMQ